MTFYYFQLKNGLWSFWLMDDKSIAKMESTREYKNEETVRAIIRGLQRTIPGAAIEKAMV